MRLPRHWSKSPQGDVKLLLKSLYGLRQAPKRWFDLYKSVLEKNGWTMSARQPGLFYKPDVDCPNRSLMWCSVYVDDSLLSGPTKSGLDRERKAILDQFPGRQILPQYDKDGNEVRDILGATLLFNRVKRYMKLHM